MDYKVGTADGQSKGLQVLGLGEPIPRTSSDPRVESQCKLRNNVLAEE